MESPLHFQFKTPFRGAYVLHYGFDKQKREVAERVGFEPTHAVTRLADFESAPLGLLGTFPQQN